MKKEPTDWLMVGLLLVFIGVMMQLFTALLLLILRYGAHL